MHRIFIVLGYFNLFELCRANSVEATTCTGTRNFFLVPDERESQDFPRTGTRNFSLVLGERVCFVSPRTGRERKLRFSLVPVRGNSLSYRARGKVLFLLAPARERKLHFSSCRFEELLSRTGREKRFCFSSYRR
jgi:hypothetical protein